MRAKRRNSLTAVSTLLAVLALVVGTQAGEAPPPRPGDATIVSLEGKAVEVSRAGSTSWDPASTAPPYCVLKPGDRLRTGLDCRAVLRLSDQTVIRLGPLTYLQIPPEKKRGFNLFRGVLYFFHRDRPGEFGVQTPTVSAVVRGTEFNLQVEADGTTTMNMFDGMVALTNPQGELEIQSGQEATVRPGEAPKRTAALAGARVIQWLLYYPGVLDIDDLALTPEETRTFAASLAAYRQGDLLAAQAEFMAVWTNLPPPQQTASDRIKVYHAALDLAVGNVTNALALIGSVRPDAANEKGAPPTSPARLAAALVKVVEAVGRSGTTVTDQEMEPPAKPQTGKRRVQPIPTIDEPAPASATEWMRLSIVRQSRFDLPGALQAARKAAEMSPSFGFARVRVGELEFGAGRFVYAREALERSLQLSPRNAQALSLRGYLLAAQNRIGEAIVVFDRAIALDGGLPTAWAGRGLCKIRQGWEMDGVEDLQVAATLEPQVSIWRSYLGKAYSNAGDNPRARRELELARAKDPMDPTSYLYAALLNQQENRINEAVRDLEKSLELNETRGLYRDQRLLDQDRAVRSANLASIYKDAGMAEVSVREAMRTLNSDYASFPGHLFLSESYNALRGLGRVDVRYETPTLDEYLVANLLSSASAGTLSPYVTQQEYSKFFERDRFGFASTTEFLTRNPDRTGTDRHGAWYEAASQFGNWGSSAYSVDMLYRNDPGQRPNNDLKQYAPTVTFKHDLNAQDTFFFQGQYAHTESGDLRQDYYNQGDPDLRIEEAIEPILLLGYHRAWTPFSHTLVLGGYFRDWLEVADPATPLLYLFMNTNASRVLAAPLSLFTPTNSFLSPLSYQSTFQAGSAELQHILQFRDHSLVGGARFQGGAFDTESSLGPTSSALLATNAVTGPRLPWSNPDSIVQDFDNEFYRASVYGYFNWRLLDPLLITAGVSYDYLNYPEDFRYVPISSGQAHEDQWSPKVGVMWTPTPDTAVRGAYAQSLGGVGFDQSFRLEPTQVGGFNQSVRSFIPESVAGSVAGAKFENAGVAFDQRFNTGTYLTIQVEWLHSEASQALGSVNIVPPTDPFAPGATFQQLPSTTPQDLDYHEKNLLVVLNQLVGGGWSFGVRYRRSDATLESNLPQIPFDTPYIRYERESILNQVNLDALFNHPSGFFSGFDALWTHQSNSGYEPDRPGDDFWQFNAFVGYRFYRRHAEVRLALLNITDQDYRLNELNLTADLPRDRTLAVNFKLNF